MTKKIFYQFVLKTVGLFTLKEFIESILQTFSLIFFDSSMNASLFLSVSSIFLMLLIKVGLIYVCLFKTDKIIELLKLADDDNTVLSDWYFDMNTLLSLAIIIMGLLLFIDALPLLVRQLIFRFENKGISDLFENRDRFSYLLPGLKLLIGFLLISNYKLVVRWINNTSETKEEIDINE